MSVLRFDGLHIEREGAGRLRFYVDGDVVVVSSPGTAAEVSRWISRERDSYTRWTLADGALSFTLLLDFTDRIERDALRLLVTSEITGYAPSASTIS